MYAQVDGTALFGAIHSLGAGPMGDFQAVFTTEESLALVHELSQERHVGLHLDWTSGVAAAVHGNKQVYMLVASMPLAWRVATLNSAGYMPFVPAILLSTSTKTTKVHNFLNWLKGTVEALGKVPQLRIPYVSCNQGMDVTIAAARVFGGCMTLAQYCALALYHVVTQTRWPWHKAVLIWGKNHVGKALYTWTSKTLAAVCKQQGLPQQRAEMLKWLGFMGIRSIRDEGNSQRALAKAVALASVTEPGQARWEYRPGCRLTGRPTQSMPVTMRHWATCGWQQCCQLVICSQWQLLFGK